MELAFTPDAFPCGCLITTLSEQLILRANPYFYQECQQDPIAQQRLSDVLTPASKIVLESFVMPMLLDLGHCEEIQLTVQGRSGERLPVLVNARVQQADEPLILSAKIGKGKLVLDGGYARFKNTIAEENCLVLCEILRFLTP